MQWIIFLLHNHNETLQNQLLDTGSETATERNVKNNIEQKGTHKK